MFSCTSANDANLLEHTGCLCHRQEVSLLTRRINADLTRRGFVAGVTASLASLGLSRTAAAQPIPAKQAPPVLFTNCRLFNGKDPVLREAALLIEGNRIAGIASDKSGTPDGAKVIDCGGRVIMPGLIDAHWHTLFAAMPIASLMTADVGYIFLAASQEAERTLLRGFTTVRDMGGPAFALKRAIDEGIVAGPRIYPSGAMITTTGGHGDLRPLSDLPSSPSSPLSLVEKRGASMIVDGRAEVQRGVREQMMQGASQIKLAGGGGVATPRSPLDMATFSEAELRAGVGVAEDWNTYVAVHAYTPHTVQRAVAAGAKCIEHAHLMDEPTAKVMADKAVWLSTQPFVEKDDFPPLPEPGRTKALEVLAGTNNAYELAKAHKLKVAFGSDLLFSERLTPRQGTMLTHLTRWFANADILTMATAINGELLNLSGPRNPYPGKLGVLEEGALADLLLVDGDPLANIDLVRNPDRNFLIIMKDGKIYKNKLDL